MSMKISLSRKKEICKNCQGFIQFFNLKLHRRQVLIAVVQTSSWGPLEHISVVWHASTGNIYFLRTTLYQETHEAVRQSLLKFLNLGTIYILGQIILCFSIYWRIFRSILGLCLLDAVATPKLRQPKVLWGGKKPPRTRTTSYKAVMIIWYSVTDQLRPIKARDVLEGEFKVGFSDQERSNPLR